MRGYPLPVGAERRFYCPHTNVLQVAESHPHIAAAQSAPYPLEADASSRVEIALQFEDGSEELY